MTNEYRDLGVNREDLLSQLGEYRVVECKEDWIRGVEILKREFAIALDCDVEVKEKVEEINSEMGYSNIYISNRFSLVASMYYLAYKLLDKDKDKKYLSDKLGISTVTIKKTMPSLRESLSNSGSNFVKGFENAVN